jgi:hypothetical protein
VTHRASGDEGQSSVELALVLPVVALLALLAVQAAVVAHRQVLTVHAAREAARAAAVAEHDPAAAARTAAERAGGLDAARLLVDTTVADERVEVLVRYREPTDVAIAGRLLGELTLSARAVMRREAP